MKLTWPRSVLIAGAVLVFIVGPILGDAVAVRLALGIAVLWFLIGPGGGYASEFAKRLGIT